MATSPEQIQGMDVAISDQNKENVGTNNNGTGESILLIHPSQQTVYDGQETRSETQSPRRMRDIHLDGNVDDMQNVNPYLLDDPDLDIRSDVGGVAGSLSSLMSGRSSTLKSITSARRQKIKSAGGMTPVARSNAGSRARQLKDHEGSPFLSIGTPQERNAFSPEIIKGKLARSSFKGSRHSSLLSVSSAGLTSTSVKSSMEMTPSARNQRSKLFSSNSMIPPSKKAAGPNHNVKMPFKHSVKKPDMNVESSNPSNAMKDRTATATHALNKLLLSQKPTRTTYVQGKLLKARLQPLEPVTMTTPTIHQCRGIVAETRQYGQCESRTFQRWKAIMAGNHQLPVSKGIRDDLRDGAASTCESVHLTSQASSPEPEVDFPTAYDLADNGFDDAEWAEELGGPINENGVPQNIGAPSPFSVPNSRCGPVHCDEALSHLGGPAMTPIANGNQGQGQDTPSMMVPGGFVQTTPAKNDNVSTVEEETSNGGLGTSDTLWETTTVASSDVGQNNSNDNVGVVPPAAYVAKRPHSAVYHQENNSNVLKESRLAGRPRTAIDGSRKAVRFADESNDVSRKGSMDNKLFGGLSGGDKEEEGPMRRRGGNKNGRVNGKSSCKPRSLDSGFDDRDDKDDDDGVGGGGGNKGRTFLTQGPVSGSGGGATRANSQNGGRQSGQGNTGKQNGVKNNGKSVPHSSSIKDIMKESTTSPAEKINHEISNLSSSSCLSASVFYDTPKEKSTSEKSKKNTKSGFVSAKMMSSRKNKTPRDDTKLDGSNVTKRNKSLENEKIESTSTKLSLCKQESSDSGISDGGKDENCGVKSQTKDSESHCASSTVISTSSKIIRPTSSSVKRMKAYKALVAKSKTGNLRPYSSSVYSDVEIQDRKATNKQQKELRPASAVNTASHSDILHIQGKYGLYAGAKTVKSKPTTPKSRDSTSTNSSKSGKGDKSSNSNLVPAASELSIASDVESQESHLSNFKMLQGCDNTSSLLRPKSSSKVTFADEDEYEDDRSSRKSNVTSAKSMSQSSSILRGSATGYTHSKAIKHANEMVPDDIDYDQMWAELPDDNSDVEKSLDEGDDDDSNDNCDENYVNDDFMSKFDMLQNQFDAVAAEFASERTKLSSHNSQLVAYNDEIDNDENQKTNNEESSSLSANMDVYPEQNQNETEYKYTGDVFVSEEEMAAIRASGYMLENDSTVFVTDNSSNAFDDRLQIIDSSYDHQKNKNDNNVENGDEHFCNHSDIKNLNDDNVIGSVSRPEFLHYEEPGWKENGWVCVEISQNLYKATNRYVEVKPKDKEGPLSSRNDKKDGGRKSSLSISSRIDHGQKKNSNSKGDNMQGRKFSKSENDDENLKSESRKPVYKMEDGGGDNASNSVHIVIPSMDDYGFGFSCEGTAKPKTHRALSSRAATPVAARKLSKSKKEDDNEMMGSKNDKRGKKESDLCINANSCNIVESRPSQTPLPKELINDSSTARNNAKNDTTISKDKSTADSQIPAAASNPNVSKESGSEKSLKEAVETTNNYYDLLLAYRSYCMEDSDNEDDNEIEKENYNNNDNETMEETKKINKCPNNNEATNREIDEIEYESSLNSLQCNGKNEIDNVRASKKQEETLISNTDGSDSDNLNHNVNDNDDGTRVGKSKEAGQSSRPISAVTTDSGLESDWSHGDDASTQSQTPPTRPDSGVLSESCHRLQSRPDSGVSSDYGMDKQIPCESTPLEIIASSKNLIKQSDRGGGDQSSQDMEKLCTLPPLCFQLNSRPPSGHLYYFAYGPNMNSDRIACYLGCEKSPPRFWGLLFGFGLVFNMKGASSNSDQVGGLPNLEWNPGMSVEGCVYQITEAQLDRLDKFVGYPKTVEHVILPVWMSNSLDPDSLGVAQYCVPALTFIARDEFTWKEPVPASDYSVSQCVKSGDLVTPEFKDHLASFSRNNQAALVEVSS